MFKGALNHTNIKLYSMANIERAIKAALAKRGLEFSLKDQTLYLGHCKMVKMFWSFCQQVMGLLWKILKYFSCYLTCTTYVTWCN
jgi:hypothetical protein